MKTIVNEGSARIRIEKTKKISKEMGIFYNPVMSLNRDISVLLLNSIAKNNLQIADPLAATGVRSIRFLKELRKNKIKNICINDYNKDAVKLIKKNEYKRRQAPPGPHINHTSFIHDWRYPITSKFKK